MSGKVWYLLQQGAGTVYLIDKSPTLLGRKSACDIVVDDPSVSIQHLQFNVEGKSLVIHDLQSTNGTLFNGQPVKSINVRASDQKTNRLEIGDIVFNLHYGPPPTSQDQPSPAAESEKDTPQYFFTSNGTEYGPLTNRELFAAVDDGELHPTDDFWVKGMDYRVKAFEVEGLFDKDPQKSTSVLPGMDHITSGAIICPSCWNRFKQEDILFIAGHPDLGGDPLFPPGSGELLRFLPTRFTPEGLAIDAEGVVCPDMACPTCHMRLPSALLTQPPLFMSIVGETTSGKSYFLASSIWKLRTTLPKLFNIRFVDVDAVTNRWLNNYEERLFFQTDDQGYQTIRKTDMQEPSVYRQMSLNNMSVSLSLPSLFTIHANEESSTATRGSADRTLVLYDNAGEHFRAGEDTAANPGTKHLVHAEGILFFFDPTVDPRFRAILKPSSGSELKSPKAVYRQDILLIEMIGRIRKHLGMSSKERLRSTIIVGISKADLLADLLPLETDPWKKSSDQKGYVLNMKALAKMSDATRCLLDKYAPEIVTNVESFAENVIYLPNSALGHNPDEKGIRPCDIKPRWVEVPVLYVLARLGYVPTNQKKPIDR